MSTEVKMETKNLQAAPARTHAEEMKANMFKFVSFQPERDSPSDARNALLVVAALTATITFDKGTDPPDGVKNNKTMFLIANTFGFSASMAIVEFCSRGFPFQIELRVSISGVSLAYVIGVVSHIQGVLAYTIFYLTLLVPFLARAVPILFLFYKLYFINEGVEVKVKVKVKVQKCYDAHEIV